MKRCGRKRACQTLSLPPDVVGAIFQFLKPAHVLDAAPTAKAWAEAGESKLVWDGLVAQTVDTAVRDVLAVGGASTHDAKADAAVRNALEHCEGRRILGGKKIQPWRASKLGHGTPLVFASHPSRRPWSPRCYRIDQCINQIIVISLDRRVYDCTVRLREQVPPCGSSNIRRRVYDCTKFFDIFAHSSTPHANQTRAARRIIRREPTPSTRRLFDGGPSSTSISTHDDGPPPHAQGHARLGRSVARRRALLAGLCADARATTTTPRDRAHLHLDSRSVTSSSSIVAMLCRVASRWTSAMTCWKIAASIPSSRARTPPGARSRAPSRRRAAARRASGAARPGGAAASAPPRRVRLRPVGRLFWWRRFW